jgi:uncharacterized protein YecT (DUF1311 family)
MFRKTTLALILLLNAGSAYAVDCNNAVNQADMNQCAGADYLKADAQLNKTYKEVVGKASTAQKLQLKEAQNAWIKFRDIDCKFQSSGVEGGSMYSMVVSGCLAEKTVSRTKELNSLLHCKEGDTSCALAP